MKTLKPSEIAEYCDVHHRTVSRWIANGQLKGHKLPGRGNYRVQLIDFLSFLQQQKMPVPPDLATVANSNSKRILVIDDEVALRNAIRRVLLKDGYQIELAEDGFQGGVKLSQFKPDVLTLDLAMPGLNGYEVLQFIRQQPEFAALKVLVISGLGEDALTKALDYGADAVLNKPFENAELQAIVAGLISEQGYHARQNPTG
jgi:excisionase family DNA binding protein